MIKTAQDAYLAGRQAAMIKLSQVGGMSSPAFLSLEVPPENYSESVDEREERLGRNREANEAYMQHAAENNLSSMPNPFNESVGPNALPDDYVAPAAAAAAAPAHYAGTQGILNALRSAGATANEIRQGIGLGGRGLSRNMMASDSTDLDRLSDPEFLSAADGKDLRSAFNPMNYATMENLSRAGMLGGALGGTYLGGMNPRAAALASAGALGGGFAGGGLGMALGKGIDAYIGDARGGLSDAAKQRLIAGGGALGGLGGGLAAGQYL